MSDTDIAAIAVGLSKNCAAMLRAMTPYGPSDPYYLRERTGVWATGPIMAALKRRGLVTGSGERYELTDHGKSARAHLEASQ